MLDKYEKSEAVKNFDCHNNLKYSTVELTTFTQRGLYTIKRAFFIYDRRFLAESLELTATLLTFATESNRMYYKCLTNMATTIIVYDEPNELTKVAIQEARSGCNRNKVYTDVDEMFNDILNEGE